MSERRELPKFAVLDGGMATELVKQGHQEIDNDPLWSSRLLETDLEAVKKVHIGFLEAGCDIVETNTYQATIQGLKKHLLKSDDEAAALLTRAVDCAREACTELKDDRVRFIAGSIGPYGAAQHDGSEYTGSYADHLTSQELTDWHRPQVQTLVSAGVDLLAFDTIPAQKEALAIASLLEEYPAQRAWISFSCRDGKHTVHGEKLKDVVKSLQHFEQVFGIGINCTHPQHISPLLREIRNEIGSKTLLVYPNSGETWTPDKSWYGGDSCIPIARLVPEWLDLGAQWIGGCCRTGPEDIKDIARIMQHFKTRTLDS